MIVRDIKKLNQKPATAVSNKKLEETTPEKVRHYQPDNAPSLPQMGETLSPADAWFLQRTIGNQATEQYYRTIMQRKTAVDLIDIESSLSPILTNARHISQSITPNPHPVIHRKIHKRYERQWNDAVHEGYIPHEAVQELRDLVAPLKNKADSKLKDVISLSNWVTKAFKNKAKKRKIQALLWLRVLEVGPEDIAGLKLYKAELKSASVEEINDSLGIEEAVDELIILVEEEGLDFADPPWEMANGVTVKDSGHGGVVIVDFPNGKLVVKAAKGGGLNNEIFGSRLAQQLGMASPDMRFADSNEAERIELAVEENGANLPAGRPYVVMRYVPGVTGGDFASSGQELSENQVHTLAMSIGRWFAFDMMIQEQDRFGDLGSTGMSSSVNSANFMIDPENISSGFVSIDQNVSSAGTKKSQTAFGNIVEEAPMFAYTLGRAAARMIPGRVDEEEIGEIVMASARETLRDIGLGLTEEDVRDLAVGLGIEEGVIESIMRTVNAAREQFG